MVPWAYSNERIAHGMMALSRTTPSTAKARANPLEREVRGEWEWGMWEMAGGIDYQPPPLPSLNPLKRLNNTVVTVLYFMES